MNRNLLAFLSLLALITGGLMLSARDDEKSPEQIASPELVASESENAQDELPLYSDPIDLVSEQETQRDVIKQPTLSLEARSARDGKELSRVKVTIQSKELANEAKTKRPGTGRTKASEELSGAPPKDGRPFTWGSTTKRQEEPSSSPVSFDLTPEVTAATELTPGEWSVSFEAAGYVSQTKELSLKLGDEESLSVSLVRAAIVQGAVQDRFGRALGGSRMLFIPPGVAYPRFSRELQNVFSTTIDREGNITPISLPEDNYLIAYGNLGSPKLQTQARLNAGETNNLEVVFGGKSRVRFELDTSPEEKRRIEVRLEVQDLKKIQRDEERLSREPQRAAKGKAKERWKAADRTTLRDGVGEIFNAKPGTYRVTLLARPGEYSSSTMLTLEADESVLINMQLPNLLDRSGPRKNDPKTPKEGPLNIRIQREPRSEEWKQDGIYWR